MPKSTFINLKGEKKEKFLNAALSEFSLKGFHGASLTQLVRHLGMAKGSLYQYFEDKDEMYIYLISVACQRRLPFFTVLDGKPREDFLFNYLLISLKFDATYPHLSALLYHGFSTFNPSIQSLIQIQFGKKIPQTYLLSHPVLLSLAMANFAELIASKKVDLEAIITELGTIPVSPSEIVQIVQKNIPKI